MTDDTQPSPRVVEVSPNTPPWLLAVIRLGVISVIAMWFVYRVTTVFETRLGSIETYMHDQNKLLTRLQDVLNSHEASSAEDNRVWLSIARQICVNTAQNDDQRRQCVIYPR